MKEKRSAGIALRRSGRCRLCDPPQAENPAKQDSLNKKTRNMYFRNLFLPLSGFSATDISGTVDTARAVL
ncbi:MAG: hypothetical protein KH281_04320 [Lachnospiraceae bacterium]|nr:hypothetical protein [Lachnospiraceae bacterium]